MVVEADAEAGADVRNDIALFDHEEIEELLLETSDPIKAPEGEIGMGVLDLEEALEEAA